jgi:hypothetical protein
MARSVPAEIPEALETVMLVDPAVAPAVIVAAAGEE